MLVSYTGQTVDLGDHEAASKIIRGSGPEQLWVTGNFLFVAQMHSDKVEVFRVEQNPAAPSGILAARGFECTGADRGADRRRRYHRQPRRRRPRTDPGLARRPHAGLASHVQVIKDTHGKTSQLTQADLDALIAYLMSLQ